VSPERLQKLAKDSMGPKNNDREAEEAEANKISDAINQVQTLTISTSKNEFFRAKMLQEEEKRRQEKDLADLDRLVQKEREKERCIQTFLEREATRLARKTREKEAEQELTEIKKEVTDQVSEVKNIFSKKIMDMRREYEQKKMDKMKELTDYKLKITSMLIDADSKGSASNCKQDKQEVKDAYCNARFPYSWFENKHCRELHTFCGTCCGKEFGVKYVEQQGKCVYECQLINGLIEKPPSSEPPKPESTNIEIINNP